MDWESFFNDHGIDYVARGSNVKRGNVNIARVQVELWEPVVGFEGWYEVSSWGRIRSVARYRTNASQKRWFKSKLLKPSYGKDTGYYSVTLYKDFEEPKKVRLHVLVCEAFHGPKPSPKHEVNHKDGVKPHCHCRNLEWATPKENNMHRASVLKAAARKLTHEQTKQIKKLLRNYRRGLYQELADRFGVSRQTIYSIKKERTWGHL